MPARRTADRLPLRACENVQGCTQTIPGLKCAGASRRSLGLATALLPDRPAWLFWLMPLIAAAIVLNIFNRIRGGVASAS